MATQDPLMHPLRIQFEGNWQEEPPTGHRKDHRRADRQMDLVGLPMDKNTGSNQRNDG